MKKKPTNQKLPVKTTPLTKEQEAEKAKKDLELLLKENKIRIGKDGKVFINDKFIEIKSLKRKDRLLMGNIYQRFQETQDLTEIGNTLSLHYGEEKLEDFLPAQEMLFFTILLKNNGISTVDLGNLKS